MILTEGVYGMTGDLAKLRELCELKERYEARLFIDDAHGFGVMGEHGRGTAEYWGVQDKVDIFFATFAKAFASIGGFSAASKEVVEWIRYNARTQVFAKSLPMIYVRGLRKTLDLVINGGDRRKKLFDITRKLSGVCGIWAFSSETSSPPSSRSSYRKGIRKSRWTGFISSVKKASLSRRHLSRDTKKLYHVPHDPHGFPHRRRRGQDPGGIQEPEGRKESAAFHGRGRAPKIIWGRIKQREKPYPSPARRPG